MKTIFSAISVLAVVYLAMQTQVVQGWTNKALAYATQSDATDQVASKLADPQKAKLAQHLASLQVQNEQLLSKIASLEEQIENMLSKHARATLNDPTEPKIIQGQTIGNAANSALGGKFSQVKQSDNEILIKLNKNEISDAVKQQQKRIQQQAMLRELSSRMELSAISHLSK